jgi:hypothetical protein
MRPLNESDDMFARSLAGVLVFCFAAGLAAIAAAQSDPTSQWQGLSPRDFLAVAKDVTAGGNADSKAAIARHAANLFSTGDALTKESDYGVLVSLFKLATPELDPDEKFRLANQLSESAPALETLPYLQLRQKVALMFLAGVPLSRRAEEVASWVEADKTGFDGVWEAELSWLYNSMADPQLRDGSFAVAWSGRITAPRTGDYVLSISPVNVNAEWRTFYIRNHWSISVGGREVLKATPKEWVTESAPVRLVAGQPVELTAATDFEVSRHAIDAIHAMLLWQGPGLAKQVIPASALSTSGGKSGLDAQYKVKLSSGAQTVSRIDPAIDFAWITDRRVVFAHDAAVNKLRAHVWSRCMDPEFLSHCESPTSPRHRHPFLHDLLLVECLSSSQRQAFLEELQRRPELLAPLDARQAINFYKAFRFGADEAAIDVLGQWAQLSADLASVLPNSATSQDYFTANRHHFHDLGRCIAVQSPGHMKRLEEDYLISEDGGCSLPAAYMLAYAYQDQGRIADWLSQLKERLEDRELVGDIRLNWLIALAMAQEIAGVDPSFFTGGNENVSAGIRWLDEAHSIADSEENRWRTAKELICREVAQGQFKSAVSRMSSAASSIKSAAPSTDVARIRQAVGVIEQAAASAEQSEEEVALELHVKELARRQQNAVAQGRSEEAGRLQSLIPSDAKPTKP